MGLYRFVSQQELTNIRNSGYLSPSKTDWHPYSAGQAVFFFEINNPNDILNYVEGPAKYRKMKKGDSIFIVEITNQTIQVEKDKSASGWPDSRAHLGKISISKIGLKGEAEIDVVSGRFSAKMITFYQQAQTI